VNGGIYWHAEMFGVDPRIRGQGIARQLLVGLRNHALAKDIKLIKYNFDPTEVRNARMYIKCTGGIGRKYSSNHYGMFLSPGSPNPFSGRLIMECWLESLHTRRCMGLETSDERSLFRPKIISEVLVPAEMVKWKQTGDIRAIHAYKRIDEQLRAAFARELSVLGFRTESDGNSFYELGMFNINEL
jgi:predicted GNAT superfamily acetyltransferase